MATFYKSKYSGKEIDEKLDKVSELEEIINNDDNVIGKGESANSAVLKDSNNTVAGKYSVALNFNNSVSGSSSTALGYNNTVKQNCCFATGANNSVYGPNSSVDGLNTIVEGHESHAEGSGTKVFGHASHGEGMNGEVYGDFAHVEGLQSIVYAHSSHAEGVSCIAGDVKQKGLVADEKTDGACHAEGVGTNSIGLATHTEGQGTVATGIASHSEGLNTKSGLKGYYFKGVDLKNNKIYLSTTKPETIETKLFSSVIENWSNNPYKVNDMVSIINGDVYFDLKVIEIKGNIIKVENLPFSSISEENEMLGDSNYTVFCLSQYRLGVVNISLGSHAEGYNTRSFGIATHSEGLGTITKNIGEHASGKYNVSNGNTQFSIGVGTSEDDRKNAFEVKQNGDIYIEGVEGRIQDKLNTSPDWNAQEGEAGYIKNKPFFDYINLKLLSVFEVISEEYSEGGYADKNGIVTYQLESYGNVFPLYIKHPRAVMGEFNGYMITKMNPGDEIYESIGEVTYKYYKITAGLDTTDENSVKSKITIKASGGFNVNNIYCHDWEVYDSPIVEIDKNYIPDTVIKTTPQTLSDVDKNQALDNLGIDPVALKYIIKPLVIDYESGAMELPEDLANIVLPDGRFNESVLNMIVGWTGEGYRSITRYDYVSDNYGMLYAALWFGDTCYGLDVDSLIFTYLEDV